MAASLLSRSTVASSIIALFCILVRLLRFRRRDSILKRFPDRSSFRFMTLDDAYKIQLRLVETEFPTIFFVSAFFALFKTYGIPSISTLLASTGELCNSSTASKRATDTMLLMTEIVLHHPSDSRAIDSLARINYLHSRFRRAGKISNDDMLYTLSLFVLEPIRWTERFEWRCVSDAEKCAMGMYWKYLGQAMEIPFASLPSSYEGGWKDGLHFLDELESWSRDYEIKYMVPAEANRLVAEKTIEVGLHNVPKSLRSLCMEIVYYLLDERLRKAMGFPEASSISTIVLDAGFAVRRFLLRHFALPRPYMLRWRWATDRPDASGRLHAVQYTAHPWYIRPSFWNRWGGNALLLRLVGGSVPGERGGEAYHPEGYRIPELGPEKSRGSGEVDMQETREKLREGQSLGCPFFEL